MKFLIENWNKYFSESIEESFQTHNDIISFIKENPKQLINIDKPMGGIKKFGAKKKNSVQLIFDYGEWPTIINPSDNMGWDFIIVPSHSRGLGGKRVESLFPIGYVKYNKDKSVWKELGVKKPKGIEGNTKIIVSPEESPDKKDIKSIEKFFSDLVQFKKVVWIY